MSKRRKFAVLQWRPWHYWHWEDGSSKKDFTDSSDFWLQQVKWSKCCISNIIIHVYAQHNQLNIDLLRNESGRATGDRDTRSLFSTMERSREPRVCSKSMINTHTNVKRCCKAWMTCKKLLLIWWIVAGIIHGDLDISNFIFDKQVCLYTAQMP